MSDRRYGSQCDCYNGPGRTEEADREHEVPGVDGALAPLQEHRGVSTAHPPPPAPHKTLPKTPATTHKNLQIMCMEIFH